MSLFNKDARENQISSQLADIATNLSAAGADRTGVAKCTSLFTTLANNNTKIYIPNGTFSIDDVTITGDLYLIGNGKNSLLKCGKIYSKGNVYIDGVHFISSTVANGDPATGSAWGFLLECTNSNNVYNDCVIKNSILEFTTDSNNVLSIYARYMNKVLIENNKIYTGGIEIDDTHETRAINNTFDMHWANINEVFHFNVNNKNILVDGNTVYNTQNNFIDLYCDGSHATISNNYVEGIQNYPVEVKTIYRDVGDPNNSSTIEGSINNVIFENNRFIDIRFTYGVHETTVDNRTIKVNNDTQYYSRDIRFINNYFDFTTSETAYGNPYLTASCVVFYLSGGFSPVIERNIVKATGFQTTYFIVFEEDSQETMYPVITGNEIIPNEYSGVSSPSNYLIYVHANAPIVGGLVKDNILYGKLSNYIRSDSTSVQLVFDGNTTPNIDTSQYSGRYQINLISTANYADLTFKNMRIYNIQLANVQTIAKFINCVFTGMASNLFSSTGTGNEYHINGCDTDVNTKFTFGGGTIAILRISNSTFRCGSNIFKGLASFITKFYSQNNRVPYLTGTTWDSTGTLTPTKIDDSTKI